MSLGTGFIDIRPDLKGFGTELYAGMRGVDAKRSGHSLGGRIAGATGVALKTGVKVAGGIAAGALSTALFSGFKRLNDIEEARKKLEGLGHSAKSVDSIMKSALASVKGTAYGLGDAAKIAASTVAAGVKPGRELTYTLKNVADAAAIGGTSLEDMGQIFNKVAALGHVTGREINQLGIRGIPILQLLGKQLGKTPEEIQKMVSQGKISFSIFQKAMHDGLAGSALKTGETVKGAFANMLAALSRVGAGLLSGVFPLFQKTFAGLNTLFDDLQPAADAAGKAIGKAVKQAIRVVKDLLSTFRGGDVSKTSFVQTLRSVGDWIRKNLLPSLSRLSSAIRQRLAEVVTIASQFVRGMLKRLRPLMPTIRDIFRTIGQIVVAAVDLLTVVIRRGTQAVGFIWKHFGNNIMDVVSAVFKAIVPIIRAALHIILGVVRFVTAVLKGDWSGAWKAIKDTVKAQLDLIKAVVKGALRIVVALVKLNIAIIKKIWQGSTRLMGAAWDKMWGGIKATLRFVWSHVIQPIFRAIANKFLDVVGTLVHGAAKAFGWVPGVGPKLRAAARHIDKFRREVNRALGGIHNRDVKVGATYSSNFATILKASGKQVSARQFAKYHGAADGGPIKGPGTGRSDTAGLWALSNGEHVWTAKEVAAAGGHFAVEGIRRAVLSAKGLADGGAADRLRFSVTARGAARAAAERMAMNGLLPAGMKGIARAAARAVEKELASAVNIGGSGVRRWAPTVLRALALLHQSSSWLPVVLSRMNRESGGNPRAINLWDSNARAGMASRGLMQTIPGTFAAYAGQFRRLGIYNPLANIYAGLNYALHRYGSLAALSRPGGYDAGGMLHPGRLGINGTRRPERVLSPEQTAAFDRLVGLLGSGAIGGTPRELVVKDADGALIGRMQVEASNVLDAEIRAVRLGGY